MPSLQDPSDRNVQPAPQWRIAAKHHTLAAEEVRAQGYAKTRTGLNRVYRRMLKKAAPDEYIEVTLLGVALAEYERETVSPVGAPVPLPAGIAGYAMGRRVAR